MRRILSCFLIFLIILSATPMAFAAISSVSLDQTNKTVTEGTASTKFIVTVSNDNRGHARETTFSIVGNETIAALSSFSPEEIDLSRNETKQVELFIDTGSLGVGDYQFSVKASAPEIQGSGQSGQSESSKTSSVITLTIEPAEETPDYISYESAADENFNITVELGTPEDDAVALLAETVAVTGTGGESGTATIAWTIAGYDAEVPGDYTATGELTLPEGWTGDPKDVTAIVTVEEAPEIEYESTAGEDFDITVGFGTPEEEALNQLATEVGITGTNGETDYAAISWTIAGYDADEPGGYTATGVLTLPEGWTGEPDDVTATVTVQEAPAVPDTIHYVALGDSLVTGTTGVSGTMTSYVHAFFAHLEDTYGEGNVTMTILAEDGDASWDLLDKLNNNSTIIDEVSNADIITISIGGNNIMPAARDSSFWEIDTALADAGTENFAVEYNAIIGRINYLNSGVTIIASTLYNPYNSANQPRGYEGDTELHNTASFYIEGIINAVIRGDRGDNYHVAEIHDYFLENYGASGKMGDVTFFYPRYNWWSWLVVRLTRDPHLNQAGQNHMGDIHIDVFKDLNWQQFVNLNLAA